MSALYGLDPSYLAALALKDAQHAAAGRPGWAPAYGAQGEALHLLERYREAEDAWLEGLRLEPDEPALQAGLAKTKAALDSEADGSPSKK